VSLRRHTVTIPREYANVLTEKGRREERAAIVALLRAEAKVEGAPLGRSTYVTMLADCIERGEHLEAGS
jgi:hypothetical protein